MVSELSSKGIGEVTGKKPTGNGVPRAKTKSGSKPVKAPKLRKPAKRSRKEQAELVKQAAATLTAAGYPAGESLLKKRQKARG